MTPQGDDLPVVWVLGPVALGRNANLRHLKGELAERLLVALSMHRESGLTADDLSDHLWSGMRPRSWSSAFRLVVSRVRRALADCEPSAVVECVGGRYRLVGPPGIVDAERFTELVRTARTTPNLAQRQVALEEAIALWRDPTFRWPEFAEDWYESLLATRDRCEVERFSVMIEAGDHERALSELADVDANDPASESRSVLLAEAQFASGKTEDAQRVLNSIRKGCGLVGLVPGAAADALQRKLLLAAPTMQMRSRPAPRSLFGRDEELALLCRHLEAVGAAAVIEGDAGIGKSHLVRHVVHQLGESCEAAYARGIEMSSPGSAVLDLLRSVSPHLANGSQEPVDAAVLLEVALAEAPQRLVIVEDAHLLDHLSVKLLRKLLVRSEGDQVRCLVTARPGPWSPLVRDFLQDLSDVHGCVRVSLRALQLDGVDSWFAARTQLSPSRRWAAAKRAQVLSGGFPIVLEHMVALPEEVHHGRIGTSTVEQLFPYVADQNLVQFHGRGVLQVAALFGQRFDLSVVAEALGCSLAEALDAMQSASAKRSCRRESEWQFQFLHDLVRQAVLLNSPVQWRCDHQRRLAEVAERRGLDNGNVARLLADSLIGSSQTRDYLDVLHRATELVQARQWDVGADVLERLLLATVAQPWLVPDGFVAQANCQLGIALDGCSDVVGARAAFRAAWQHAPEFPGIRLAVAIQSAGSSQPYDGDAERTEWLHAAQTFAVEPQDRMRIIAERCFISGMTSLSPAIQRDITNLTNFLTETSTYDRAVWGCTRQVAVRGVSIALTGSDDPSTRIRVAQERESVGTVCHAEHLPAVINAETLASAELGLSGRFATLQREFQEVVDLLRRPGDVWVAQVTAAAIDDWFGEDQRALDGAADALIRSRRYELFAGESAYSALLIGRTVRVGCSFSRQTLMEGLPDGSADVSLSSLLEKSYLWFIGSLGGRPVAFDTGALVAELCVEPVFMGWAGCIAMCTMAMALAPDEGRYSGHAFDLLQASASRSGQIVTLGAALAGVLGPMDGFRSVLCRLAGDETTAEALRLRAVDQTKVAQLSAVPLDDVIRSSRRGL